VDILKLQPRQEEKNPQYFIAKNSTAPYTHSQKTTSHPVKTFFAKECNGKAFMNSFEVFLFYE
jgi:phosphopantetheinyl transferase (holo-ACP synthase)